MASNTVTAIISIAFLLMIGCLLIAQMQNNVNPGLLGASYSEQVLVNSTASLGPYQLTYYPIIPGTVTISIGSTVYQEGVDYTVDYPNGTFTVIAGSSLAAATATATYVNVSYKYEGGQVWNSYQSISGSMWGALNLMGIYPWVLVAAAIMGAVIMLGKR